jgi:hypothetical protein
VAGGSARPLGTTARTPGATARRRGCGSGAGRWGWHLSGSGGTARAGASPGGSARTTACCWGRHAVVTQRIVIGPFELKFNQLNMNSTV